MKHEKIGAIKEVDLPDNWIANQSATTPNVGLAWQRVFSPRSDESVQLTFKYRGVPIDEASRKVFNFLLTQETPGELGKEEILALHTILGVATVGDNQYTNKSEPGSLEGPRFRLDKVFVENISEKQILRVQGEFSNSMKYDGVYFPAGVGGTIIEEVFLQAPNAYKFDAHKSDFQTVLNSISWN